MEKEEEQMEERIEEEEVAVKEVENGKEKR